MASLLHSTVLLALLSIVHAVAIYRGTPPRTSEEHAGVHQDPEVNMNAVSSSSCGLVGMWSVFVCVCGGEGGGGVVSLIME